MLTAPTQNSYSVNNTGKTIYNPVSSSKDKDDGLSCKEIKDVRKIIKSKKLFEKLSNEILQSGLDRDALFSELLKVYIDNLRSQTRHKRVLKICFFIVLMLILIGVVVTSFLMISFALGLGEVTTVVSTVVAAVVEFSVAFFKLPQIVAKYLFDKTEDHTMAGIIKDLQKYNLKRCNTEKK